MAKLTSDDPRQARGRERMKELADEMKRAIAVNSAIMIAGLNREATPTEVFTAEAICALFLRARRVRESGRDDSGLLRQAAELTNSSVFRPPHAAAPATEQLAPSPAEIQHGKAVALAFDEHNRQHQIRALHGWSDDQPEQ